MTEPVRIFIDDRGVSVAPGTTVLAAVAGLDPARAERVRSGLAYLTDGRGIRLDADTAVYQGAIFRVVISARTPREESDAHP